VVGDIENRKARSTFVFLSPEGNLQTLHHQQIEGEHLREAPAAISWPNEVLLFIQTRKRKSIVPINHRRQDNVLWQCKLAPEE